MRTLPLSRNGECAEKQEGQLGQFRLPPLSQITQSAQKVVRVGMLIGMGGLIIFAFYLGFTLLALKILL